MVHCLFTRKLCLVVSFGVPRVICLGPLLTLMSSYTIDTVITGTIRTPTGNLTLNPTGTSIDFSGKNFTNAVIPSTILSLPLDFNRTDASDPVLRVKSGGSSFFKGILNADGEIQFGNGISALDLRLYRSGNNTLTLASLTGQIPEFGCNTINTSFIQNPSGTLSLTTSNSSNSIIMRRSLGFNDGTANSPDTFLYRSASNTLAIGTSTSTSNGTLALGTLNATLLGCSYGAATFYRVPIQLFGERNGTVAPPGVFDWVTKTIPAGLVAAQGDRLEFVVEGQTANTADNKTIVFSYGTSPTVTQAVNLRTSSSKVFKVNFTMTRTSAATNTDMIGDVAHDTLTDTFGGRFLVTQTISNAGTIKISSTTVNSGDVIFANFRCTFYPAQS